MKDIISVKEIENERKGQIAGMLMLLALLGLLLLPLFWFQNPPPGQEGIQVNLGIPNTGQGDDLTAGPASPSEPQPQPEPEPTPSEPVASNPTPTPRTQRDVVTTEDPSEVNLRKQRQQEEAARKAKEDADRRAQEEAARKAREAEAARQAEARRRQQEADQVGNEIGGLFSGGNGGGNTGKPGDSGATNGDPNSTNIGDRSFGSGTVGGGLSGRGGSGPRVSENSSKSGKVVVKVCVDASGKVIPSSVEFTQSGSTTTDSQLVNAAIANARQWSFKSGSADRQCGTITYNFKVQ